MKLTKYLFILSMLFIGFTACDDDETEDPQGGNGSGTAEKVAVSFAETGRTVLRNGGQVQIPIRLEEATTETVRVNIGVEDPADATVAEEGIDFNIEEKVINIAAGDTLAYLMVDVLDDGKANNDKSVNFTINSVYGAGVKAEANQNFTLQITSNAFVEFEKSYWEIKENALSNEATENDKASRFIPLRLNGKLNAPATVVFEVIDSTAVEPTHFTIEEKEILINPDDADIKLEIRPVDDEEINTDRFFSVRIKEVHGGNLSIGKGEETCVVKIISDEVRKTLTWIEREVVVNDVGEIEIPFSIDIAPEAPVTVKILVSSSNAIENVDYESISEVTISEAGEQVIKLNVLQLAAVDLNLDFEVVDDNTIFVSEANSSCHVVLLGEPSFGVEKVSVKEGSGSYTLKLNLPLADKERVVKLEKEVVSGEGSIIEIPTEVTVPANVQEVDININVGIDASIAGENLPIVNVNVTGINEFVLAQPVKTSIEVLEWKYRRWWGTYKFTFQVWANNTWNQYSCNVVISNGGSSANNDAFLCARAQSNIFTVSDATFWFNWDKTNETISSLYLPFTVSESMNIKQSWNLYPNSVLPVTVTPYTSIILSEMEGGYLIWSGSNFTEYLFPVSMEIVAHN